jgi:hypothetical protein
MGYRVWGIVPSGRKDGNRISPIRRSAPYPIPHAGEAFVFLRAFFVFLRVRIFLLHVYHTKKHEEGAKKHEGFAEWEKFYFRLSCRMAPYTLHPKFGMKTLRLAPVFWTPRRVHFNLSLFV